MPHQKNQSAARRNQPILHVFCKKSFLNECLEFLRSQEQREKVVTSHQKMNLHAKGSSNLLKKPLGSFVPETTHFAVSEICYKGHSTGDTVRDFDSSKSRKFSASKIDEPSLDSVPFTASSDVEKL